MEPGLRLSRRDHSPRNDTEWELMSHTLYRSLVGSLMYLAIGTRPDIAYAIQQLCKFLDSYGSVHWEAGKHVVRYLKGTRTLRLVLGGEHVARLLAYTDSDLVSCVDTRRSVSGYSCTLGAGVITWSARQQKMVALSTCEAEYVAALEAGKEIAWLRMLLQELGFGQTSALPLMCDNNGAIVLTKDALFHAKVKHIDIAYHSIRERITRRQLKVHYVRTHENVADIFTKALARKDHGRLRSYLGLR